MSGGGSVRGVYVLGVSVQGVHVWGGYVLEPWLHIPELTHGNGSFCIGGGACCVWGRWVDTHLLKPPLGASQHPVVTTAGERCTYHENASIYPR